MKFHTLIVVATFMVLVGCEKKQEPATQNTPILPSVKLPAGHPPINSNESPMSSSDRSDVELSQKAIVISSINVPQFTYLEITQNEQTRWLAASTTSAQKGDVIQFDNGATMNNFNSKALNRIFPSITFVNRVVVAKKE